MKNSNPHGLEDNPRFSILQELQESKKKVKNGPHNNKKKISDKLDQCRENLQNTVDNISVLEKHREKERMSIDRQFEKMGKEMLLALEERRKQLQSSLDEEVDAKINELLERTKVYQEQIAEGMNLQPSLQKLEDFEKSDIFNIDKSQKNGSNPRISADENKDTSWLSKSSLTKSLLSLTMQPQKSKFFSKKKKKNFFFFC
ncbi:hypothetical protein RFI_30264 [Reticulomyxa filosa]|uniref:Uncharacterized protein n=1 Tax=Reticulomyxa filosa TaxID=46433 RepID=X6LZS2_RETFI|nr:hypothetical protein RFI_30264 [Reticulomyxa filosa]|eukprot:ETO07129.1 hypothetical protein RFI_30264 [Reticulomyxa filosa]